MFHFHTRDVIAGKHEVTGIENARIMSCNMESSNEAEEASDLKSFSNEYEHFDHYHASELGKDTWNGLDF